MQATRVYTLLHVRISGLSMYLECRCEYVKVEFYSPANYKLTVGALPERSPTMSGSAHRGRTGTGI